MEYDYFEAAKEIQKYWENNQNTIERGLIFEKEILHLEKLTNVQVSNIYNFIGLFFDTQLLAIRLNGDKEFQKYLILSDCLSATKQVICGYLNKSMEE